MGARRSPPRRAARSRRPSSRTRPACTSNDIPAGSIVTNEGLTNAGSAQATLTVNGPPAVGKRFSPVSIAANGTSTLTLTLANPNAAAITLSSAFVDALPGNVFIAAAPNVVKTYRGRRHGRGRRDVRHLCERRPDTGDHGVHDLGRRHVRDPRDVHEPRGGRTALDERGREPAAGKREPRRGPRRPRASDDLEGARAVHDLRGRPLGAHDRVRKSERVGPDALGEPGRQPACRRRRRRRAEQPRRVFREPSRRRGAS